MAACPRWFSRISSLRRYLFASFVLLALAAAFSPAAGAATIVVNSSLSGTGLSGDCTLAEAIQAANTDTAVDACTAGSGADIIQLPSCTISVLAPDHLDGLDGAIGFPDIVTVISIVGQGSSLTIIERAFGGSLTLFRVAGSGNLTLESVTVKDGNNTLAAGGLVNRGRPVTVRDCAFENNLSPAAGSNGGAITSYSPGVLIVDNCTFDGNSAGNRGGAIWNGGTATVDNSTFTSNTAFVGGAFNNDDFAVSATITDSSFSFNSASAFAGALHSHVAALTVERTFFLSNTAVDGGGAMEGFGAWVIRDSEFTSNQLGAGASPGTGGAIRFIGGDLLIERSSFSSNMIVRNIAQGGALYVTGAVSPAVRIRNSTFSGNSTNASNSNQLGGGIYTESDMELNNVTLADNFAWSGGGPGLYVAGSVTSFLMGNSILAITPAQDVCFTEAPAVITSRGHNILGVDSFCNFTPSTGDQVGTSGTPILPQLSPLRSDLGGMTSVRALLSTSPALNAGSPETPGSSVTACETTDQRGVARPVTGQCDIGAFEGVLPQADLGVAFLSDLPDPVVFGNNVTYTISLENFGPDTATAVSLSHTLPSGFTFVSAISTQGTCSGGVFVVCNIGTMLNGGTAQVTVVAQANRAGLVDSTVSVTSSVEDPTLADNSDTETTNVTRDNDLTLTKTAPASAVRTNNFQYSLTVRNNGTVNATNVVVSDTLPTQVTFVSATPSQGSCSFASGDVTCNLGTLAGQADATITITVTAATISGGFNNTATVTATEADPDLANNSDTAVTQIIGTADISVTKLDTPDPVALGQDLTYTIVVTNNGPDPSTNVELFDVLPDDVQFVSVSTSFAGVCTQGSGMVSCGFPDLGAEESVTVIIVVKPTAICDLVNSVSVNNTNDFDPNSANNTATTSTTVIVGTGSANLAVTKSGSPDPVQIGSNLTYTITVSNAGPDAATSVVLNDFLPDSNNVTFVSVTPSQGTCAGNNPVSCSLGTINNAANATVTLVVSPSNLNFSSPTPITNTVSVSSNVPDPDLEDNTFSLNTTVNPTTNMTLNVFGPASANVGDNIIYNLEVGLLGPSGSGSGTVTFSLPTGTTFNSSLSNGLCSETSGVVTCGSIATNISATSTIQVAITTSAAAAPSVTANFTLTSTFLDPDLSNNTDSVVTTLSVATADLAVTKSDLPDPVAIGGNVVYSLTVTNNGPDTASSVVLTDTLSAGATFVSASASQGSCTQSAGTVTCNLGNINLSSSVTITITAQLSTAGSAVNSASVTAGSTDPVAANNTASATTTVGPATYLGPTSYLSLNDSPFLAGITAGTIALETFEDGVLNVPGVTPSAGSPIGPGGLTDSVDGDDGSINGSGTNGRSFFSGSGATGITFTFNATILGGFPTQAGIVWTDGGGGAQVFFEAFDATGNSLGVFGPSNNADGSNVGTTAEDRFFGITFAGGISAIKIRNVGGGIEVDHLQYGPVPSPANASVTITKADSPDPVAVGSNLTYTLTVANSGTASAAGVTATDALPGTAAFVSVSSSQGTCSGTANISCSLGTIAAGAQATVTIVITPGLTGILSNTAAVSVSSATNDLFFFDNSSTASTTVGAAASANLFLTKTDTPDPVVVGSNLTYTLTVGNIGPNSAASVVVTDTLPANVSFVSSTASQGTCSGTAIVTCNLGTLATEASATVTIVVTPQAAAVPSITNSASVTSATADPNSANNSASVTTTVNAAVPGVTLSTSSVNFGNVQINTTSAAQFVTLTNSGTAPLSISSVALTGANAANFVQTNNCPAATSALAPDASCTFNITFSPNAVASFSAAIVITSNAPSSPSTITLAGAGIDFNVTPGGPTSVTIVTGGTATFPINVTVGSPTTTTTTTCTTNAPAAVCIAQPNPLTGSGTVTIVVTTVSCVWSPPAPPFRAPPLDPRLAVPWAALLVALMIAFLASRPPAVAGRAAAVSAPRRAYVALVAVLVCVGLMSACSATTVIQGVGTGPGTYNVVVSSVSGSQTRTLNLSMTVTLPPNP